MKQFELQVVIEPTSLGLALVAGSDAGICAVLLGEDGGELRADLERRFRGATLAGPGPAFRARAAAVLACVEAPGALPDVALDLRGTEFQREVWQALREIPAGATASYRELAVRLGRPSSARAVGQAIAANPVAVIVPCHRAIRSDGSLSGYRWGMARKRALLEREAAAARRLPGWGA